MNSKVYKWCAVPLCKNTSIATPNKLFVYVPNKKIVKDKWLQLARRDPACVVTNSRLYFCEDHFDLPKDMENYMQYHVMGSVSQIRMKSGCMPKKFACQPDRNKQTTDTQEPYISKKRKMVIKECEKQFEEIQHSREAQPITSNVTDKSIQDIQKDRNLTENSLDSKFFVPIKIKTEEIIIEEQNPHIQDENMKETSLESKYFVSIQIENEDIKTEEITIEENNVENTIDSNALSLRIRELQNSIIR